MGGKHISVRVNLLPSTVHERNRRTRQLVGVGAGFGVLIVALGAVWFWQNGRVTDAREQLAAEEAEVARLNGEVTELSEFAQLERELAGADEQVATLMSGEIGVAGLLQNVAAVMPTDTELSSLSFTATPDDEVNPYGDLAASGRTISRHAPGLERLLIELGKVAGFRDPYFGSAAVDNDDAVAFDVSVQLGPEVLTGRYFDGIPEALR